MERWDTLAGAETLIRPYKGEASRHTIAGPREIEDAICTPYVDPLPAVRGIAAYRPFYLAWMETLRPTRVADEG
jgi:uncharacterized protein (DUF427 family)